MGRKKDVPPASDLLDNYNPTVFDDSVPSNGDTPYDKTYDALMTTGGKRLELLTRTTPKLAQAVSVGYTMIANFKSSYLQGKIDTLMRLHVSMGGKGRAEMVDSLKAGSGVPDAYYDASNPAKNSFIEIEDEEIPDGDDGEE